MKKKSKARRTLRCETLEVRQVLSAAGLAAALDYAIVDTGQEDCFDNTQQIEAPTEGEAFYGQDAQYNFNLASYSPSADGLTVYDNITGLTWTQSPDLNDDGTIDTNDKLTFEEAQSYPDVLNAENFGGHNDWRLPSIKELYSLIDFNGTDPVTFGDDTSGLTPFINADVFDFAYGDTSAGERIIDSQYWTSTEYVSTTMGGDHTVFGVNFADGRIKGYGTTAPNGSEKVNLVHFVRGGTAYGENQLIDNGDGTITDTATGLMWMQDDSGAGMDWEDALSYAENLDAAGYDDWLLPDAKQLQSIVDYSRSPDTTGSAAIDPIFNVTQITDAGGDADYPFFWTSTTHARGTQGEGNSAVYIAFGEAEGWMAAPGSTDAQLLDVHGAGAQRSDPKAGDPDDYPTGRGPQGDTIHINNYVRAVRYVEVVDPGGDPGGDLGGELPPGDRGDAPPPIHLRRGPRVGPPMRGQRPTVERTDPDSGETHTFPVGRGDDAPTRGIMPDADEVPEGPPIEEGGPMDHPMHRRPPMEPPEGEDGELPPPPPVGEDGELPPPRPPQEQGDVNGAAIDSLLEEGLPLGRFDGEAPDQGPDSQPAGPLGEMPQGPLAPQGGSGDSSTQPGGRGPRPR